MEKVLYLPNEILIKILIFTQNMHKFSILNKNINNIINYIVSNYNKLFIKITKRNDWLNNLNYLVKKLIESKDLYAIVFLLNNYRGKTQEIINFYAGYYNYKELINLGLLNNYIKLGEGAAQGGHLKQVEYTIRMGVKNLNWLAYAAAKGGKLDIVKYLIPMDVKNLNYIAAYAAEYNHNEVVYYLLNNGADDLKLISVYAAVGGNLDFIKYAINNGVTNYVVIGLKAAENGRLNIVEFIYPRIPSTGILLANAAAKYGHTNIILWLYTVNAINNQNIPEIAGIATKYDKLNVLKLLYSYFHFNLDDIMIMATQNGFYDIVEWGIEHNVNILPTIAIIATRFNHPDILKLAVENGASNYQEILSLARMLGNVDIEIWIKERMKK